MLALLCLGIFAGAMALHAVPPLEGEIRSSPSMIWNVFQYGLPLMMAGICLTGKRWAFMAAVIYGTIGLALDISTLVQSITEGFESKGYFLVIITTGLLNFLLIVLGGKFLLSSLASPHGSPKPRQ